MDEVRPCWHDCLTTLTPQVYLSPTPNISEIGQAPMPSAPGIFLVPIDPAEIDAARQGRSYSEVARAAHCSPSFFWELCHGSSRRVTAALAARIEDALIVERGDLFTLEPADALLLSAYGHCARRAG